MEVETSSETPEQVADISNDAGPDLSAAPVANITEPTVVLEDILGPANAPVSKTTDVITSQQDDTNGVEEKTDSIENKAVVLPKETGTFNLGVPGLKFSSNNVKTAKDGTKMVQIHQSQITPDQLVALQNNPNIKVVFRHVPSGKSYTKPPRHLLPPGYSAPIKKRKAQYTEEELENPDVYSFDEGEDFGEGPAKRTKYGDFRARYSYGGSGKKRGRPRLIPDVSAFAASFLKTSKQQNLPAKVVLTDLLARVNNPNAKKEVKLHTSQINTEVLANMELNPAYKILLTTKQELPPLVIESVNPEEQAKLEKDAAEEIEKQEKEKEEEVAEKEDEKKEEDEMKDEKKETEEKQPEDKLDDQEEDEGGEERRLEEEREEREKEAARLKKAAEEEEELVKSVMQSQKSRSGRIRKPSRYSLDIARLTKRKNVSLSGDSSADESEQETRSRPAKPGRKPNVSDNVTSPSRKKKDLEAETKEDASPKKDKSEAEETEKEEEEDEKKEDEKMESEPEKKDDEEKKTEEPETDEKTESKQEKEEQEAAESEKEITSTENVQAEKEEKKPEEKEVEKEEKKPEEKEAEKEEKKPEEKEAEKESKDASPNDVVTAEPDTSTDAVKTATEPEPKQDESMDVDEPFSLKEEEGEKEVIDNKFRLRKLLEQCSTEEIRSVLLPEAFDSINMGDFLLYKAGQMHNSSGKISFPQLYKEFENLHKDAAKEAVRYNTLVSRANKVGGDKRMEKIVLMPVYNIQAASSLEISNSSSIDAHICGIQRTITTEMIAANSFFIKAKMEPPLVRLKLPEATAPKHLKPKTKRPLYTNQHQQKFASSQQQEPDSTTPDKPKQQTRINYGQKIGSMKFTTLPTPKQNQFANESLQVRRPAYIEQLKTKGQISVSGQNHQIASTAQDDLLQGIPMDSTNLLKTDAQPSQMSTSATSALAQLQATVEQQQQAAVSTTAIVAESATTTGQIATTSDTTLVTTASGTTTQAEQFFVTEDGVPVTAASTEDGEVRKHLVPIGDGQYVELPEGYSLIQTDEGYIIGQPGSTFTQGEDGNVYVTNSDGTTAEITQQDVVGEGETASVANQVTEA